MSTCTPLYTCCSHRLLSLLTNHVRRCTLISCTTLLSTRLSIKDTNWSGTTPLVRQRSKQGSTLATRTCPSVCTRLWCYSFSTTRQRSGTRSSWKPPEWVRHESLWHRGEQELTSGDTNQTSPNSNGPFRAWHVRIKRSSRNDLWGETLTKTTCSTSMPSSRIRGQRSTSTLSRQRIRCAVVALAPCTTHTPVYVPVPCHLTARGIKAHAISH